MVQNDFSSTSCYYRYENIDKSDDDDALLFLSRLTSFLPRRGSFCASPVGLSLPDRRVSVCVCVCARKTPREEEEEEEEDVRLCQCRLILKGKEMQKDDAKKKRKKNLSHSIKLSLYRRATNADEGRRTTKAAATRA